MVYIYLLLALSIGTNNICPEGQVINSTTGECTLCPVGEGIFENGECGICPNFQGINKYTGKCGPCSDTECIGLDRMCVDASSIKALIDPSSKKCICRNFEGFDKNGICSECINYYCVEPNNYKCVYRDTMGSDPQTGKCIICKPGEGLDQFLKDGRCFTCPDGSKYSQQDNTCS